MCMSQDYSITVFLQRANPWLGMLHSDDKGLVMPPRVARLQTILIPVGITNKMSAEEKAAHGKKVDELYETLKKAGVRVDVDNRDG